jgi:hypothetical protein
VYRNIILVRKKYLTFNPSGHLSSDIWRSIILYQIEVRHTFLYFILEITVSNLNHDADYADRMKYAQNAH